MDLRVPKTGILDIRTKSKLAEYADNLRTDWNKEKTTLKTKWDPKKRKHIKPDPKWGYIRKTVDDNFPSLKNTARDVNCFVLFKKKGIS